uniref:Uncharacterized protein n=1 Tax=viral metagenome TaxID=1070528 RepID=A0A6M3K9T4_9ZZZZ
MYLEAKNGDDQMARFKKIVSSRNGTIEVWRRDDEKLFQAFQLKSGQEEWIPLQDIPSELTVNHVDGEEFEDGGIIPDEGIIFPAIEIGA